MSWVELAIIAVWRASLFERALLDGEFVASVQSRQSIPLVIGTFKDVNLTIVWPFAIAQGPKCRPCATSFGCRGGGRMLDIGNEETVSPCIGRLNPDRRTANTILQPVISRAIVGMLRVGLQLNRATIERSEAILECGGLVDVSKAWLAWRQGLVESSAYVTKPWVRSASELKVNPSKKESPE